MGYELEINLLTVYNGNPAIMVLSYAKSSFFGKIFGIDEDEFLSDEELSKSIAQGTGSFRREADIVLSGNTYKVSGKNTELGATITATLEQKNGAVTVRGTIKDTTGNDRRFRVEHSLPVDADGWHFGINLNEYKLINM